MAVPGASMAAASPGQGPCVGPPPLPDGGREVLARTTVALPDVQHAQEAEAWGCCVALELLEAANPEIRRARVAGDNLAVVRYCAAEGRLRRPAMQCLLGGPLARLATGGWAVDWLAVRRRLNRAADELATEGVFRAAALAAEGRHGPDIVTRWGREAPACQ